LEGAEKEFLWKSTCTIGPNNKDFCETEKKVSTGRTPEKTLEGGPEEWGGGSTA